MELNYLFLLLGLNHKTASVEIREKLSFKSEDIYPLEKLRSVLSFKEGYFLSTCNRVEFGFIIGLEEKTSFLDNFFLYLEKETGIGKDELRKHFYVFEDDEAIKHLFEVACGLDSMVLGEPQILNQVKQAYKEALKHHTSGLILNKLFHRCFFVAKRVRTETGIGGGAVSISYAACELAKKILGSLKNKVALLVGAGEMAELACMHFISAGVQKILISNRTISKAIELAHKFKGEAYSLEELPLALTKADIVISSTGAPSFVITKELVSSILKARKYKPLFIIDIAVPRDVDPEVNNLENVYLYNIDDLKGIVEENLKERKKEAIRAKVIIEEEVFKFKRWTKELKVHPTIKALSEKIEIIRQRELSKTLKKLKNLSDEEKEHLEILTKSLVQKILIYPIEFIKNRHHEKTTQAISIIREMFKLDEHGEDPLKLNSKDFVKEKKKTDIQNKSFENLTSEEKGSDKKLIIQ